MRPNSVACCHSVLETTASFDRCTPNNFHHPTTTLITHIYISHEKQLQVQTLMKRWHAWSESLRRGNKNTEEYRGGKSHPWAKGMGSLGELGVDEFSMRGNSAILTTPRHNHH
jgi:hypothetical protein